MIRSKKMILNKVLVFLLIISLIQVSPFHIVDIQADQHVEIVATKVASVYAREDVERDLSNDQIWIEAGNDDGEGYYQFDLSGLEEGFDFIQFGIFGSIQHENSSVTLAVYGVEENNWDENIMWIDKPTVTTEVLDQVVVEKNNGYSYFDVTEYVRQKLGEDKVVSFALVMESLGEQFLTYGKDTQNPPKLFLAKQRISPDSPILHKELEEQDLEGIKFSTVSTQSEEEIKIIATKTVSVYANTIEDSTDHKMRVKKGSNNAYSYYQFDLSDIEGKFTSIKLGLFGRMTKDGGTASIAVYGIDEHDWAEEGIVWATKPEISQEPFQRMDIVNDATEIYHYFDITEYVNEKLLQGDQVISIVLTMETSGMQFFTRGRGYGSPPILTFDTAEETEPLPDLPNKIEGIATKTISVYAMDDPSRDNTQGRMRVQKGQNAAESYYQFDLSDVTGPFDSIQFGVYGRVTTQNISSATVSVCRIEENTWDETMTWDNRPTQNRVIIDQIPIGTANDTYYFDVTEYVNQRLGEDKIVSLVLIMEDDGVQFFTRGHGHNNFSQLPKLYFERIIEEEIPSSNPKGLEKDGRSALYPEDWYPGYKDEEGRHIQDFSYAGYHKGEKGVPNDIGGLFIDVTQAPYGADSTGETDVTEILQQAIDTVGEAGGGVVYLPAGTYRINPQTGKSYSLKLQHSNVVLRGAGTERTFLLNEETNMRGKDIISVTPGVGSWGMVPNTTSFLTRDLSEPTTQIPVQDATKYSVGDWVIICSDVTTEFIQEHDMNGWWDSIRGSVGPTFYRQVTAIDKKSNTVVIDIPTRYFLKMRDHARIYKVAEPISEIGIEDLSIGNIENPNDGWEENDYTQLETGGYEVHGTKVIYLEGVVNSWVQRVKTFKPKQNEKIHILSNGIVLEKTRNISILNNDFRNPQYRGAGGNGYLFEIIGNDNLIQDCMAVEGRHNYTFSHSRSNGNVIHRSVSKDPSHVLDFHMYLSMSNLLDGMVLYNDTIEANVRANPVASNNKHGMTTSQTVIWNTTGYGYHPKNNSYIIDSRQFGHGYVIGTQGSANQVRSTPIIQDGRNTSSEDYIEGVGQGDILEPQSLYEDQLRRRSDLSHIDIELIQVNGEAVVGFSPLRARYDIELPYGTQEDDIPEIQVISKDQEVQIDVIKPSIIPGQIKIDIKNQKGEIQKTYILYFTIAAKKSPLAKVYIFPDKNRGGWRAIATNIEVGKIAYVRIVATREDGRPVNLTETGTVVCESSNENVFTVEQDMIQAVGEGNASLTIRVIEDGRTVSSVLEISVRPTFPMPTRPIADIIDVTASADDGNVAENTIDSDPDSRWSAEGTGQWIQYDLGKTMDIDAMSIAFFSGDKRKTIFQIEVSQNGRDWTKVYDGQSSGTTNEFETFEFGTKLGRYVRIMGQGNTVNGWNSITEVCIHAQAMGGIEEPIPDPTPDPTPDPMPDSNGYDSSSSSEPNAVKPAKISITLRNHVGKSVGKIDGEVDASTAMVQATLSMQVLSNLLAQTPVNQHGQREISIEFPRVDKVDTYSFKIPSYLQKIKEEKITLSIKTPLGSLTIPTQAFINANLSEQDHIQIQISRGNKIQLTHEGKEGLVDHPLIAIEMTARGKELRGDNLQAPVILGIPYEPNPNEEKEFEYLVVYQMDTQGSRKLIPQGKYDPEKRAIVVPVVQGGTYEIAYHHKTFEDSNIIPWAQKAIEILASKGIINGTSQTKFTPEADITRGDFLLLLVKTLGLQGEITNTFTDIDPTSYYYEASNVAKSLGVAHGSLDNKFHPEEFITREDMMVLIHRSLSLTKQGEEEQDIEFMHNFEDKDEISSYAMQSIEAMVKAGIVKGDGKTVRPKTNATRAEVATILYRIYNK